MTDRRYVAGLDVGTTGCKIAVFDDLGENVKTYYTEYNASHTGGLHEISFCDVRCGVLSLLSDAARDFKLEALGVTSFGETFAMLDGDDNVLCPSMLYTDPRGKDQCRRLENVVGPEKMTLLTGVKPNEMYSISKIMWLKEERPEVYAKCEKILLGEDFIVYTLCGKRQIDHSLAARTGAFDIKKKEWSREIFDAAGIDVSLMSDAVEAGTIAGKLSDGVKNQIGIDYDIMIVNGSHDQVTAMIGSGVFEKGIAMDGTGTVECIPVVFDEIPQELSVYEGGYSVVPFINGKYACYALSFTGGATLKWFRDNLAADEYAKCNQNGENVYAYLDSKVQKEPTDILVLPHFAGAATPYMDTSSKAAFVGVTLETTKYDLYKALMEGTSYEILLNFNTLKGFIGEVKELRATGGGASSPVWLQIKADILNTKICAMSCKEVGAAGTAALAGVSCGIYKDLSSAVSLLSRVSKEYFPNAENTKKYAVQYEKYKDLYRAVSSLGKGETK